MRDLLFRGKCSYTGEWEYGDLVNYLNGETAIRQMALLVGMDNLADEVLPITVGQFTGLLDIEWKRIFEGDVISAANCFHDRYVVEWSTRLSSFVVRASGVGSIRLLADCVDVKVIGNIHDNPEPTEVE